MAAPDAPGVRVERVLDTAAELLVRWGYQRVTIDEVARHAGIGKGTVYLHFRNKEALFLTVLLRTHRRVVATTADRIDAEPVEALPSRTTRSMYLDLAADPVTRSLYLGDGEVLGRLAHEAQGTLGELAEIRRTALRRGFTLLREHGCLRSDIDVDGLLYTFGAIAAGFFFVDGIPLDEPSPDVSVRADLLERALAAALQEPQPPAAALERVAPAIAGLYRSLIAHIDTEWRRRVR